jgi:hypothetical protein
MSFLKSLFRFLGFDVGSWEALERAAIPPNDQRASMTAETLAHLEAILHLTLPESYRTIMLSYSPIDPGPVLQVELQLAVNPNTIMRENLELRREGFAGLNWPEHHLWIGGDGGEIVYFLDLSQEGAPVFSADHETQEYVQQAVDFPTWFKSERLDTLFEMAARSCPK